MKSYERGLQLLGELGKPTARPKRPVQGANIGRCNRCQELVVWASMPSGARVPLDNHPGGALVLRDGVALELPANEGEVRYVMHFETCREARDGRKTP
jgi:hypothetical protein